jgi:Nidogen-like
MRALRTALAAVAVLGLFNLAAEAAVITVPQTALVPSTQYYTDIIGGGIGDIVVMTDGGNDPGIGLASGRNDDGFSGPINFNFTTPLSFFGTPRTSFFANNNGNITFNAGLDEFVPDGPTGANLPIISPFFGDVDTRNLNSGVLHIRTDIPNQVILTWDQVGFFGEHAPPTTSFQLVLRGPDYDIPEGEGAIGFFYKGMGWEDTDTSTVGAVGFGDGLGNGEVLEGSLEPGLIQALANHHIWFDPNLNPVPPDGTGVPAPGTLVLLGAGLLSVGATALLRRRAK